MQYKYGTTGIKKLIGYLLEFVLKGWWYWRIPKICAPEKQNRPTYTDAVGYCLLGHSLYWNGG